MRLRRRWVGLVLAVGLAAGAITAVAGRSPESAQSDRPANMTLAEANKTCPWLDSRLPTATRVTELLQSATPRQEATLLHLLQPSVAVPYEGYTPAIPALCIPALTEQDGAAGVATGFPYVTQLPAPIADAASFDPALARRYGNVIGSEDATKGIDLALAPTINIDRSPLWGRSYETLGEDPYLSATLAAPLVKGIQSNRVVSVLKHFAVYNQEAHRATLSDNAIVSERAMHEIYLPAFSAATQIGGAGAVMCSYNLINGVPACQNRALLDGVLRGDWHFNGFVRSDCGSVYQQAAAMAVGVSQVKCSPLYDPATLAQLVATGALARSTLDSLARPLLDVLFRYNLIAEPHSMDRDAPAASSVHRAVALATAEAGSVLLKNDSGLLPLNLSGTASMALIGGAGGTPMPAGFGAMLVSPGHPVDAFGALAAVMGSRLQYRDGTDIAAAAAAARRSGVAVVVVSDFEAERHDRTSLALPGNQDALVAAVVAANPRTVVVLETGSAVLMPWLGSVHSVLETWYPGETAGTALVDLLSGRANPSGKLPVTFPASSSAMPANTTATFGGTGAGTDYSEGVNVGYRWYQVHQIQPAFSFGYGLSYTRFHFSGLEVKPGPTGGVTVRATISNVGPVAGADVVQCYLGAPSDAGEPPRQLRGYTRVTLAPQQSKAVQFTLNRGDLAVWDAPSHAWVVPAGAYRIFVGDGSDPANLPLQATVAVGGATLGANSGPGLP